MLYKTKVLVRVCNCFVISPGYQAISHTRELREIIIIWSLVGGFLVKSVAVSISTRREHQRGGARGSLVAPFSKVPRAARVAQ